MNELQRMAGLAIEVYRLQHEFQPMPDETMDSLSDVRFGLAEEVMTMPSTSMSDLAAKMRMLAATNGDDSSFDPALPAYLAVLQAEALAFLGECIGAPSSDMGASA
uniref:hypothetical protein n=1 Tax=uncultured Rhizobium sp. TaxID=155567 RepID=UPI00262BA2C9|nr:hypothetical protein [uncultured Rhizobium sp.]